MIGAASFNPYLPATYPPTVLSERARAFRDVQYLCERKIRERATMLPHTAAIRQAALQEIIDILEFGAGGK